MRLLPLASCLLAAGTQALNIRAASVGATLTTTTTSDPTSQPQVAEADTPYWLAEVQKQGLAAFNKNPQGYKVFRNVKDYGAKGEHLPPGSQISQDFS